MVRKYRIDLLLCARKSLYVQVDIHSPILFSHSRYSTRDTLVHHNNPHRHTRAHSYTHTLTLRVILVCNLHGMTHPMMYCRSKIAIKVLFLHCSSSADLLHLIQPLTCFPAITHCLFIHFLTKSTSTMVQYSCKRLSSRPLPFGLVTGPLHLEVPRPQSYVALPVTYQDATTTLSEPEPHPTITTPSRYEPMVLEERNAFGICEDTSADKLQVQVESSGTSSSSP